MNVHKHARLTPRGRDLMIRRIEKEGWSAKEAAAAAGVSARAAFKWLARFRAGGERMLHDGSSAPARRPRGTPQDTVSAIGTLRRQRLSGPAIARKLGLVRSTVGLVLRRLGLGWLTALDPRPPENRYERAKPGELIDFDTRKLGRIDGIGHRITRDRTGQGSKPGTGWEVLHVAIDDASRLARTEVLADAKKEIVCAFTERAGVVRPPWRRDRPAHVGQWQRLHKKPRLPLAAGPTRHPPHPGAALPPQTERNGRPLHPNQPARTGLRRP
jgi:hypothetical protein